MNYIIYEANQLPYYYYSINRKYISQMWQVFNPKPNTNLDHTKVLLSPKTKTHIKLQRFYWTVVLRNYVALHGMG